MTRWYVEAWRDGATDDEVTLMLVDHGAGVHQELAGREVMLADEATAVIDGLNKTCQKAALELSLRAGKITELERQIEKTILEKVSVYMKRDHVLSVWMRKADGGVLAIDLPADQARALRDDLSEMLRRYG